MSNFLNQWFFSAEVWGGYQFTKALTSKVGDFSQERSSTELRVYLLLHYRYHTGEPGAWLMGCTASQSVHSHSNNHPWFFSSPKSEFSFCSHCSLLFPSSSPPNLLICSIHLQPSSAVSVYHCWYLIFRLTQPAHRPLQLCSHPHPISLSSSPISGPACQTLIRFYSLFQITKAS